MKPALEPRSPIDQTEPLAATGAGRYDVQRKLAEGGMGQVFRAVDRTTGAALALKRIGPPKDERTHQFAVQQFEREYQVLKSLEHPRIIRVYDYGLDEQGPYYTMELVHGDDLRKVAPLPPRRACAYLRDIATSLALLHGRRLLHRDLSPANVRLTGDGHCKLLDFGALADFGQPSQIVGTPPFIPPEALRGMALDQRADLYALGALLYFALTARFAYPARSIAELPQRWREPLLPPSAYAQGITPELDKLVLSLLRQDPLARPAGAAEVIARLDVIADLPPEEAEQAERLAQSFLTSPRFFGRRLQLQTFEQLLECAERGQGAAVVIESQPGMGRSRLLDELCVQARLSGAIVLRADAAEDRQPHSTARALVNALVDHLPELAEAKAGGYRAALAELGPLSRLRSGSANETQIPEPKIPQAELSGLFAEVAQERLLLIAVDNCEDIDDASLGMLAATASLASQHALLLVATEARHAELQGSSVGHKALRRHATTMSLQALSQSEVRALSQSIFGDAPNQERFADWLFERSTGSPLYYVEICLQLLRNETIRYESGLWALPHDFPDSQIPAKLGDTLMLRVAGVSEAARRLVECLSLQRAQPTLTMCQALTESAADAREQLEELTRAGVLAQDAQGYRFSSAALRSAIEQGVDRSLGVRERIHLRLGAALERLATEHDHALRIEAGFHLIHGGEDLRGAHMIAEAASASTVVRMLCANQQRIGAAIEAALLAYRRHRRSPFERAPLLGALSQAGYYEARQFGTRYGDEALDVLEQLSGLASARRLRPYLGRHVSLAAGVALAFARFKLSRSGRVHYNFAELYVNLFSTVTTSIGVAALSLDGVRAQELAAALEPFSVVPERLTPAGIYQFCSSLAQITRENGAGAYASFELLRQRFSDRKYYPTLPEDARVLYLAGIEFARGSFALFRADGGPTLQCADTLDATGIRLYAMIASQLRFLYFAARGEFARAEPHRIQVELHAAHMGSIWQVETWEAAMLSLVQTTCMNDVIGATRVVHRLHELSRNIPSLKLYLRCAIDALKVVQKDGRDFGELAQRYRDDPPRGYIGWAAMMAAVVRGYNDLGRYAEAKAFGEAALAHFGEADVDSIMLFLQLELQVARAEAGTSAVDAGLARLDRLLERFASVDHPLLLGLLHEMRALLCWDAGRVAEFELSLRETERWFRPTRSPALIAKCEYLAQLQVRGRAPSAPDAGAAAGCESVQTENETKIEISGVGPA